MSKTYTLHITTSYHPVTVDSLEALEIMLTVLGAQVQGDVLVTETTTTMSAFHVVPTMGGRALMHDENGSLSLLPGNTPA